MDTASSRRPGPAAYVVGRPRIASVVGASVMLAVGVQGLAAFADGRSDESLVGIFFTLFASLSLFLLLTTRVWVEGQVLRYRKFWRYGPPVRLDRLTEASLSDFAQYSGQQLRLSDADGATVLLDVINTRLVPLYAVLAKHIPHSDRDSPYGHRVANEKLHRRMAKHRPGLPWGPG
jgi:hypothetical protein